jgi:hypothetical protein
MLTASDRLFTVQRVRITLWHVFSRGLGTCVVHGRSRATCWQARCRWAEAGAPGGAASGRWTWPRVAGGELAGGTGLQLFRSVGPGPPTWRASWFLKITVKEPPTISSFNRGWTCLTCLLAVSYLQPLPMRRAFLLLFFRSRTCSAEVSRVHLAAWGEAWWPEPAGPTCSSGRPTTCSYV